MDVLSIYESEKVGYHLRFLEAIRIPQRTAAPFFSSMGYPKRQDMILYVDGCSTRYQDKDGRTLTTHPGDVVYVPKGAEYTVGCIEESQNAATLQINFLLFRESFSPFIFSDEIVIFPNQRRLREPFERAILLSKNAGASPMKQKAILFELFHCLCDTGTRQSEGGLIRLGIDYLDAHYFEDPSVASLARMCHVSEEYFRRLFKEQKGLSPVAYKNELRRSKARQYLMYTDMSVLEISESLSYATVSHFIKDFKEHHGTTPLAFRNAYKRS